MSKNKLFAVTCGTERKVITEVVNAEGQKVATYQEKKEREKPYYILMEKMTI